MTPDAKTYTDETPIHEVVSSERAARHLKANGFPNLGAVKLNGLGAVATVKFVGAGTLKQLKEALGDELPQPSTPHSSAAPVELEESMEPIVMLTGFDELYLAWCPSHKVQMPGGGFATEEPIFVEFEGGRAEVTPGMYYMRKYQRDRERVRKALNAQEPWREECAKVLRGYSRFGVDFFFEE